MKRNIKVVYIISDLGQGGAQLLLFDIIQNIRRHDGIEISIINIAGGEYVKHFINAGINVIDLNTHGLINPKILFQIKKELRKFNPDIVHTHLNKADFYGRIAARLLNIPIIISTCHNYSTNHKGADLNKKSVTDRVDNIIIRYSGSTLIAVSEIVETYLINRDKDFKKITTVIYNGVDTGKEKYLLNTEEDRNTFREIENIDRGSYVITIIGRLEKQKGHLFFLEAMRDVLKGNKRIRVLIIGEGSMRIAIEKFLRESKLETTVSLKGFVNNSEKYIEISDLIVVPSSWEAFGLIIIEAMIKKRIVLAAGTGGILEIIQSGETGFLYFPGDAADLVSKFKYIYENRGAFDSLKEKAFEMVKEKFDIAKNSELYYKYYLEKVIH